MPTSSPSPASPPLDALVIGGGINGAGIARDLAGRGWQVALCEQHDLASHTSSASTKLIHGGLRYLEHGEFGLVRKALAEREVLLRSAPHIADEMRFVMPHDPSMRPAWMIRLGLFLYDHLAPRDWLAASTSIDLRRDPAGQALQARFKRAFVYSDGWVDDARLVVLNAMDAAERGAQVLTRCRCIGATRERDLWRVTVRLAPGQQRVLRARALVNATGPWAAQFLREQVQGTSATRSLRLVKGSHIVVRRRPHHEQAYLLQGTDRRVVFAIPYEDDFTLIGTTDLEHRGCLDAVRIDADEVAYLCEQASRYFREPVQPHEVCASFAGVRPLIDDDAASASAVTRDYRLALDAHPGEAPLLTVWGGKLTTYRKLSEEAADRLGEALGPRGRAWTAGAILPGGDLASDTTRHEPPRVLRQRQVASLQARGGPVLDVPLDLLTAWVRRYGTRVSRLLQHGLGEAVAPGVFEAELRYLQRHEWARTVEDVLWRRTKLGLHLDDAGRAAVTTWWLRAFGEPPAI